MVRATGAISVTIDSKRVENMLTGYLRTLPEGARLGAKAIASKYAETYLNQMPSSGITKWTGQSFNVLERQIDNPIRSGKNAYVVVVPTTLLMLDRMRKHFVALRKGRSITRWAKAKLGLEGRFIPGITVSPHPWINQANQKARRSIRRLAERELNKKIRRKGQR